MPHIISVASGKGGVGKSFISSSIALSISMTGRKVLVIDGDLGGANIHNFFGHKIPPVGLYHILREGLSIYDAIIKTGLGVDFIAGSSDILGISHISGIERTRLMVKLSKVDYDIIIIDLGAGASFNTIDLFNSSDSKIIVMNSEPITLENSYSFLKVSLYRYIERLLSSDVKFSDINYQLRNKSINYPDINSILEVISNIDKEMYKEIICYIDDFKVGAVLNMVRYKKELNVFYGFERVVNSYLRIKIDKLGFVPYDEKVWESIRIMKPFYFCNKNTTVECIDDIRDSVLSGL